MCPVCTVTVIAGLSVSRLLGIDDVVSSIWIGGLILSLSFITINWIEKSKWREKIYEHICKIKCGLTENQALKFWVIFLMYLLALIPLFLNHTIGITRNTLWGMDKILFGIFVGSIVFLIGIWIDKTIRKGRDGKQLFHFQKVVFPVSMLAIASAVFYLVT
ncbi:MAG TPA: hypothetical protein VFI61_04255 [Patescibacteria group bacterium]|nr:hypothetical protein [Patescibacteria group bacterium]